jgi:hypothetical protein
MLIVSTINVSINGPLFNAQRTKRFIFLHVLWIFRVYIHSRIPVYDQ